MGGYRYYLKRSKAPQSNLTGYVRYEGSPCCTWPAADRDRTATSMLHHASTFESGFRVAYEMYVLTVPMDGGAIRPTTVHAHGETIAPAPPEPVRRCRDACSPNRWHALATLLPVCCTSQLPDSQPPPRSAALEKLARTTTHGMPFFTEESPATGAATFELCVTSPA